MQRRISKIFLLVLIIFSNLVYQPSAYGGDITLAWDASPSIGIDGYKIYCNKLTSPVDGKYVTECGRVGSNILSYKVNNLENGQRYYFVATAYKGIEESAYSNEVNGLANGQVLKASFSASKSSGVEPLTVTFTNTSTGDITSKEWDLGNGTILSGDVVSTSYSYGTWAPKLTVGDGISYDSYSSNIVVSKAEVPIVVDFMGDKLSGIEPLTVTFTDLSTGGVLSRIWNFGDGTSSGDTNPVHVYGAGVYNVTLTVNGSISQVKNGYINVSKVMVPPSNPPGQTTSNGNMVAGYGFEESGTNVVLDMSGNGNNGTNSGGSRVGGKFGGGMKFNGSGNLVTVKDSNSLDLVNGISIMAWVKPDINNSLGDSIVVKENGGNSAYYLYSGEDMAYPVGGIYSSGYKGVGGDISLGTEWNHIAMTYDGSKMALYINGLKNKENNVSGKISVSSGVLNIGGNMIWGEYFAGVMDEVKIFNRGLTGEEVIGEMGKSLSESNPGKVVLGVTDIGEVIDNNNQGIAEAFVDVAKESRTISGIDMYVNSGSSSKKIIVGIYSDRNGHPYSRLSTGSISNINNGEWNRIPVSTIAVKSGTKYWVAILSSNGKLVFNNIGGGVIETYKGTLSTLPSRWVTDKVYNDGPMSINARGY